MKFQPRLVRISKSIWRNFDCPKITYWFFISNCRKQIFICVYDIEFMRQSILGRFLRGYFVHSPFNASIIQQGMCASKNNPLCLHPAHSERGHYQRCAKRLTRQKHLAHRKCPMSIAGPASAFPHLCEKNTKFPPNQKRFSIFPSHLYSCFAVHWCTCTLPWNLRNVLSMSGRTFLVLCWLHIEIQL
jgi:hypothetical protein